MATDFKSAAELGVPVPAHSTHIIRLAHSTTPAEREKALRDCLHAFGGTPAATDKCLLWIRA